MRRDLTKLTRPRSIAVLGSGWAANVVEQCGKLGYAGEVWPVHPTRAEIGGIRTAPSLSDLPRAPDACFVGVNRTATVEVVRALADMGAGGAICFASGWSETGARDLQERLVEAAGEMPILGPNCYGLVNYLDGAAIWPDQHGGMRVERGVAIVSQSSNIAITLTMQRRGLPIAYVACVGNAAQCGPDDLGAAFLDDPRVTALGFYLEGVDDAVALAALAERARAVGKGMVALKSGRTEGGARAAASHTAALAGDAVVSSAFLRQAGIAEVRTLAELVETLKILHLQGPLRGRRVSSASCSGGEAGLIADLADGRELDFVQLTDAQRSRLSAVLGPLVTVANPLDYQTFIWGNEGKTTEVFATMLSEVDAGMLVIDPPRPDRCDRASFAAAIRAIGGATRATGRPAVAVATLSDSFDEALHQCFIAEGVIPIGGLETALAAIEAAALPPGVQGWRPVATVVSGETRLLDEATAKERLRGLGIDLPPGVSAPDLRELARRATGLRPPLALKGLGFAHKSEAGAVRLNLASLDGAEDMPGATGYLAEEMVAGGLVEMIVGVRRDQVYGATLTVGFGGIATELLSDSVTLVLPAELPEVAAALRRLRLWPLLDGYRGRARPDIGTLLGAVETLTAAILGDPKIFEIEVNPLILTADRAVAADALIREKTT